MNLVACSRSMVPPGGASLSRRRRPCWRPCCAPRRSTPGCAARGPAGSGRASACRSAWPVWIAEYICAILSSRIRLRIAGVPIMISCAATRPVPSLVLQQRLRDHRAQRLREHRAHHLLLRRREHVDDAVDGLRRRRWCAACRTRGGPSRPPVSARRMVSRSRISPTRMTSGSSRSARCAARWRTTACAAPTSRWLMRHFFASCTNSIGSSMVRMWPYSFSLMWLTIAASVVDLPDPVGPVTSTRPRGYFADLGEDLGHVQVLQRQHLGRNGAQHRARAALLHEGVDAKAREVRDLEGKVALPAFSSYTLRCESFMMS